MFIKVGGVQGVGKTKVASALQKLLSQNGYETELIKGSDLIAQSLGISAREVASLSEQKIKLMREVLYRDLYAKDRENPKIYIRDGHFTFLRFDPNGEISQARMVDSLPEDALQLKAIFLLNAGADTIARRRQEDASVRPDRIVLEPELISIEQDWERKAAKYQADKLGIPLLAVSTQDCDPVILARSMMKSLSDCRILKDLETQLLEGRRHGERLR